MVSLILLQLAIGFIVTVNSSKKYDLHKEALKLYGISPENILQEFRRTPAYLAILQTKIDGLKKNFENIMTNLRDVQIAKYEEEIERWVKSKCSKGQAEDDLAKKENRARNIEHLRTNYTLDVVDVTGAEFMDRHPLFRQTVTVEEKKKAKDIAFAHMELFIHALTKYMTPDDNAKSTLISFDDEVVSPTTVYYTDKVTSDGGSEDESGGPPSDENNLRFGTYFRHGKNDATKKIKKTKYTTKTKKNINSTNITVK